MKVAWRVALLIVFFQTFCLTGFAQHVITTVAGGGDNPAVSGDGGPATLARLWEPWAVAVDGAGDMYIADPVFHRIRKVTASDGVIRTIAGAGGSGFGGDNGPAIAAQLNNPTDLAVDAAGNLYIADAGNRRVRKVANRVIITVAGGGSNSPGDGGLATAASLQNVFSVAVDDAGNLYIAESERVRKVTNGVIQTVAGTGTLGFSGDGGPAIAADIAARNIAVDRSGNLYISDLFTARIRKVTSDGVIRTIAGTGAPGFSGDDGPATSAQIHPQGITLDVSGRLYIADYLNNRVRVVTSDGVIHTVAGTGQFGREGDGKPAILAQLTSPQDVTIDEMDNLYIADTGNRLIRKVAGISQPLPAPIFTSRSMLPNGYVGTPYRQWLAVSSGVPSYTWSLVTGDLPSGLTLRPFDGWLNGTPTADGAFTFTVKVTDSLNSSAVKTFTITIEPAQIQYPPTRSNTCPAALRPGVTRAVLTQVPMDPSYYPVSPIGTDFTGERQILDSVTFVPAGVTAEFGLSTDPLYRQRQLSGDFGFAYPLATLCDPLSLFGNPLAPAYLLPGNRIDSGRLGSLLALTLYVAADAAAGSRSMIITTVGGHQVLVDDAIFIDPQSFEVPVSGSASFATAATSTSLKTGQARANAGPAAPWGMAIFGFRPGGTLVSEATVPASPLMLSARVFAEIDGRVNTGVAIANPNTARIDVSFSFTDSAGVERRAGSIMIPGNGQVAAFLDQAPFNGPAPFTGSLTLVSPSPFAAIALRGLTNERSEFLLTTLPVSDLTVDPGSSLPAFPALFPHLAVGGGWVTQVVIVNPGDTTISGSVVLSDPSGQPLALTFDGQTDSRFTYSIPPRTARKLVSSGAGSSTRTGSVRLESTQTGGVLPSALLILSFRSSGVTVSEASVPAVAEATALRMYVEEGDAGIIRTGIAIANPSSSEVAANFELLDLHGIAVARGTFSLPPNIQTSMFLDEVPGLAPLAEPFQGILRIWTESHAISMLGLRGHYSERGDFLITTLPAVAEKPSTGNQFVVFPHFADGAGYTTQFILFGPAGEGSFGRLTGLSQSGDPLSMPLR
jgi:hypothetical protein